MIMIVSIKSYRDCVYKREIFVYVRARANVLIACFVLIISCSLSVSLVEIARVFANLIPTVFYQCGRLLYQCLLTSINTHNKEIKNPFHAHVSTTLLSKFYQKTGALHASRTRLK